MSSQRTRRYIPQAVYVLAERLKREGLELSRIRGAWRPVRRAVAHPGRNRENVISVVTNGLVAIAVDTAERAADLSGFLNWCGVAHLEPVANLRPPESAILMH